MENLAISKFKANCLAVLERVCQSGEPVLVTRRGQPIAQVVPPPPAKHAKTSRFGCMKGRIEFVGDIVSPFPEEEWEALR